MCCEDEHCRFKDTRDGCYVIIRKFPEEIIVSQDLNGSYGLYLYQNGDYFALSNSLLLLAETLALHGHRLTLNQDYLDAFLLNGYTMESCLSTPFLEITELMRNVTVRIDRKHKVIEFEDRELYDQTVDIASQEAMDILDEWYAKWTGVIHGLGVRNEHLCVDLSGGFDSRLTFLLFLGARLDKNIIHVGSYESELHTYDEDWKIANEIASRYGFFINTSMGIPKFWLTLEDFLETSITHFNEKNWAYISNLGRYRLDVAITVMRFEERTYQYLSGSRMPISNIIKNLHFVKSLREQGVIDSTFPT